MTVMENREDVSLDKNALGFDPNELREKYRRERDRRIRPEGEDQYADLTGNLAHYATDDPYADADYKRDAVVEEVDVVIVGGGFSGMLVAARLREAGINDIRIIEAGADFGGTWYWNRYPGAQCDIESYCYLPLLEETGYMPKEKYSYSPEIYEHSQRIGKEYDLYGITHFQTRVKELRWNEKVKRWCVATNWNDDIKARFVISATGPASRPKLANIPGINDFGGHTFHTSRWDYDYTGGDHSGGLDRLSDKRVAIIGTGATAIQCVPHLGKSAKELYVFQRTPSSVDLRGNKPTDPEWVAGLKPGWQRARRENFGAIFAGLPFEEDLVNDAWTEIFRNLQAMATPTTAHKADELSEIADFKKMNQIRARVDSVVKDTQTAENLKPWYRQFCKRPTFNDDYLETFNRPNVHLIDTADSHGVERITKDGVVANGVEYKVDCIVYATGFEIGTSYRRQVDYTTIGRDGESLFDHWSNGLRTFHGHSAHGFPNWFFVGIGQNGLSVNMTAMFDDQAQHVAYIISQAFKRQARSVQPTVDAEAEWVAEIEKQTVLNREFLESCTPGYYNSEGKVENPEGTLGKSYALGINAFNDLLREWREEGSMAGLEFD